MGVDARIATGYSIDSTASSASISTSDAIAWAEVLTDKGWLSVDVIPKHSPTAVPKQAPAWLPETPAAQQPLLPPQVDPADPEQARRGPAVTCDCRRWSQVRVWALRGGLFTGLLLWPFVLFSAIVTWKKVRRRKGLKAPDPARRVSTAWTLATDALVDAGATLNPSQTNAELVAAGVAAQPAAGPPLGRLQRHADAVTFAIGDVRPAACRRCRRPVASGGVEHPQLVDAMVAMEVVAQHPLIAPQYSVTAALTVDFCEGSQLMLRVIWASSDAPNGSVTTQEKTPEPLKPWKSMCNLTRSGTSGVGSLMTSIWKGTVGGWGHVIVRLSPSRINRRQGDVGRRLVGCDRLIFDGRLTVGEDGYRRRRGQPTTVDDGVVEPGETVADAEGVQVAVVTDQLIAWVDRRDDLHAERPGLVSKSFSVGSNVKTSCSVLYESATAVGGRLLMVRLMVATAVS